MTVKKPGCELHVILFVCSHRQLAAMMKRQETIQSVDSFASHDDDFAEYGDENMGKYTHCAHEVWFLLWLRYKGR